MIFNHLASFCCVFTKALQNRIVSCNLTSPFDVIFFKFPYGNGVTKCSYSKVKLFHCCLQKMMALWCVSGKHYFGRNLQI